MRVEVFNYGDAPFLKWMNDNPNGFIINTESRINSRLAFLHRSGCMHIAGLTVGHRPDAFTRYDYIKVCSDDASELLAWIFENRPKADGFSNLCKTCVPEPLITRYEAETPVAIDIEAPKEPGRVPISTYRILRDTTLARSIKALYKDRCQICGEAIELADSTYSEAHHIQPLGENGPDVAANILCVCPNHHVQLDYLAIKLNKDTLFIHSSHKLGDEYVDYHNNRANIQRGED